MEFICILERMIKMEKTKTTLSFGKDILKKLREMSASKGMDMSSYVTHLLIAEEERTKASERMEKLFTQMFPGGINDLATLARLIEGNKGEEEK